jgi:hypothetical protein
MSSDVTIEFAACQLVDIIGVKKFFFFNVNFSSIFGIFQLNVTELYTNCNCIIDGAFCVYHSTAYTVRNNPIFYEI